MDTLTFLTVGPEAPTDQVLTLPSIIGVRARDTSLSRQSVKCVSERVGAPLTRPRRLSPSDSYPRLTPVGTVFGTDHLITQRTQGRPSASDAVGPLAGWLADPWLQLGKAA